MIKYAKNKKGTTAFVVMSLILSCLFCQCKEDFKGPVYTFDKNITEDSAMVITAHPVASEVGKDILRQGGNAIDATIAVQFALAVCYPIAGNIGGGGFMVYKEQGRLPIALDFREKAPKASTEDMYLDDKKEPIPMLSREGPLSVGVPGSVAGMAAAFKSYSRLRNWKALLQPAIDLAKNGFALTARQAEYLNRDQEKIRKFSSAESAFTAKKWKEGDLLVQPELARTLEIIQLKGDKGFYEGEIANLIVEEIKKGGGIMTHADLTAYESKWRKPIHFRYRGLNFYSMPPPSSGGIALGQIFKSIERYQFDTIPFHSSTHIHLLAEVERRVYADRATHLGDSDFYPVQENALMDSMYLIQRMDDFSFESATPSSAVEAGNLSESMETTHFSIIDPFGNIVALTTTLNGAYGSKTVVGGAGFLLNNEMDDFSIKPGTPNMFGLVGAEANKIEAEKRMLSSMTPTLVVKDGKAIMALGSPGGSTIITSVFQVIHHLVDYKMTPEKAVSSPRFHHQWQPDRLRIEEVHDLSEATLNELKNKGHELNIRGRLGKIELIYVDPEGKIIGAADIRADDDIAAF